MSAVRAGIIALAVAALAATGAPAAFAGARGCNRIVCVDVDGSGLHVNYVNASTTWSDHFFGHFHIYGGGLNANSWTQNWTDSDDYRIDVGRDLPNGAVLCAEGWANRGGGGYSLMGRACEEVHF